MTPMPNPFIDSAAPTSPAADTAGADHQPPVAPAGTFPEPALDDTDCINELFYYARKLTAENRFVLDREAFMAALEEPLPLFIRDAGYLRRNA